MDKKTAPGRYLNGKKSHQMEILFSRIQKKSAVTFTYYTLAFTALLEYKSIMKISQITDLQPLERHQSSKTWSEHIVKLLFCLTSVYQGYQEWRLADPRFSSGTYISLMEMQNHFSDCDSLPDQSNGKLHIYKLLTEQPDIGVQAAYSIALPYILEN